MGTCACCWRAGNTYGCRCSAEKCESCKRCVEQCCCLVGLLDLVIERLLAEGPWAAEAVEQPQAEIIELPVPEPVPEPTWQSRNRQGRAGGSQLSLF